LKFEWLLCASCSRCACLAHRGHARAYRNMGACSRSAQGASFCARFRVYKDSGREYR